MDIFDYIKCDVCGETYFGHFKCDTFGKISCVDCIKKEVLSERLIIDNSQTKDSYEQVMVLDMLERDLGELYPLFSGSSEIPLQMFMTEDGNLILEKIYFQGNNLDFVVTIQQKAYNCLKYLDTNEKKYSLQAKEFIKTYLSLREHRLTTEEESKLKATLTSEEFVEMENSI